jgi:hypothetical protein
VRQYSRSTCGFCAPSSSSAALDRTRKVRGGGSEGYWQACSVAGARSARTSGHRSPPRAQTSPSQERPCAPPPEVGCREWVRACPDDGFGHGGERGIGLTGIEEAVRQDLDAQGSALVGAGQNRARCQHAPSARVSIVITLLGTCRNPPVGVAIFRTIWWGNRADSRIAVTHQAVSA